MAALFIVGGAVYVLAESPVQELTMVSFIVAISLILRPGAPHSN